MVVFPVTARVTVFTTLTVATADVEATQPSELVPITEYVVMAAVGVTTADPPEYV